MPDRADEHGCALVRPHPGQPAGDTSRTRSPRWNGTGKWLWSDKIVHPPIIDRADFGEVQALVAGRAVTHAKHKSHHARHPYALRGCVWCVWCGCAAGGCRATGPERALIAGARRAIRH